MGENAPLLIMNIFISLQALFPTSNIFISLDFCLQCRDSSSSASSRPLNFKALYPNTQPGLFKLPKIVQRILHVPGVEEEPPYVHTYEGILHTYESHTLPQEFNDSPYLTEVCSIFEEVLGSLTRNNGRWKSDIVGGQDIYGR